MINDHQSQLALRILDCDFNIPFSAPYCPFSPHSSSSMGSPNPLHILDYEDIYFIPHSSALSPVGAAKPAWGAPLDWRSSIRTGAPWPGLATLNFILHSSITVSTPLAHLAHRIRYPSFPGSAPLLPPNSSYCLSNSILIHHKLTSIPNLLDITNGTKRHWNPISPTRLARIIGEYMEHLHLVCSVDELCVPAFVRPDEMGDLGDDIETMFNRYHSIA